MYFRDPAERLLSGFLEKCQLNNKVQRQNHCIGFQDASKPVPTFAEFIEKLSAPLLESNGHLRLINTARLFKNGLSEAQMPFACPCQGSMTGFHLPFYGLVMRGFLFAGTCSVAAQAQAVPGWESR